MIDCPVCGVWSEVKETRTSKLKNTTRRRYECANGHRFSTVEAVAVGSFSDAGAGVGRPRRRAGDGAGTGGAVDH